MRCTVLGYDGAYTNIFDIQHLVKLVEACPLVQNVRMKVRVGKACWSMFPCWIIQIHVWTTTYSDGGWSMLKHVEICWSMPNSQGWFAPQWGHGITLCRRWGSPYPSRQSQGSLNVMRLGELFIPKWRTCGVIYMGHTFIGYQVSCPLVSNMLILLA